MNQIATLKRFLEPRPDNRQTVLPETCPFSLVSTGTLAAATGSFSLSVLFVVTLRRFNIL